MLIRNFKRALMIVMLSSATTFVFADDAAPVYDADSMPPQFDGQSDAGPLPPPPSPTPSSGVQPEQPYQSPSTSSLTMEQRVGRVEQQVNNMQHSNSASKTDELQTEVQTLRGQVEDLTHQLQQLQAQTRTMYSDLDKRMSKQVATKASQPAATDDQPADATAPATPAAAPATTTTADASTAKPKHAKAAKPAETPADDGSAQGQPNVAEEQQTYQTAYDLIKAKKYNEAIAALQKMLQKYPSGQFAANAHYWLGELYNLTGKSDQAANEFSTVVKTFPDSPKIADAQLKLGLIYVSEQKWPEAKSSLRKVINNHPGTSSSHLALEQLKQIKQSGH